MLVEITRKLGEAKVCFKLYSSQGSCFTCKGLNAFSIDRCLLAEH